MMSAFNSQDIINVKFVIRSFKIQAACIGTTRHIKISKRKSILLMLNKMERCFATTVIKLTAIVEILGPIF